MMPDRIASPRLSMQSNRTNSTVLTQIYDPKPEPIQQSQNDDFQLDTEGSQPWQAQRGWEFMGPKPSTLQSPRSTTSPTTPNFSRPFGSRVADSQPPLSTQREEPYIEDHPEQDYFSRDHGSTSRDLNEPTHHSVQTSVPSPPKPKSSRKGRYSSRSLYSYDGSETSPRPATQASSGSDTPQNSQHSSQHSSRSRTETSSGSNTPLMAPELPSKSAKRQSVPIQAAGQPTSPLEPLFSHPPQSVTSHPTSSSDQTAHMPLRTQPQPYERLGPDMSMQARLDTVKRTPRPPRRQRPASLSTIGEPSPTPHNSTFLPQRPQSLDTTETSSIASPPSPSENGEPTIDPNDIDDYDEHDALTALPIITPARPASVMSAAEPPPVIRDKRVLDGRGGTFSSCSSSSSDTHHSYTTHYSHPSRSAPRENAKPEGNNTHNTAMTSWPEVRRQENPERPQGLSRRWSASNVDISSLSPEKIAKLKKKGINPALWLEMRQAQGKKGRFGLSPLVGNTFLGS